VSLVEQELLTLSEHLSSPPVFSGFRVTRSLFFICMFCWSLFVLLYFFFWPLCCLFFDIQILIAPLVPSNSSYTFSIPCLPAHLICQRQYPDKNAFTCTGKNLIFKHTIYVAATMMHFTFWLELYMCLFIVSIAQYLHCVLVPRQALARYHSDRQWNLWPYSYQFLHWQHTSTGLKEQKYIIFKELRELSLKMNKNLLQRQNLKSYIWKTLCVKFCQN
jgi:hypothetical protein